MKVNSKYFILILLLVCGISLFSGTSGRPDFGLLSPPSSIHEVSLPQDTSTLYPVKKTQITDYDDLTKKSPIDLEDPTNIKTEVEYDLKNNVYLFKTKIDNDEWITPFTLNPEQYSKYSLRKSMSDYFKQKNAAAFTRGDNKEDFSLKDIKVNTGALDRIFGPGGVQIKTQGYVEVSAGIKHSSSDNPTISQQNRSRLMFDFDEKIQLNATASVGDKINFGLNYDTESTFDFDTKRVKLAYEGEEDEILKYLEAGNVSMNTTNSLINGGTSLFGIKADLQFGKLRVSSVISQQEAETQTVSSQGGVQSMPFEFKADEYDENQHFFLSHFFRDHYDEYMSNAPHLSSSILINTIEVWITNKQGNFNNTRNVIAFADIAENRVIGNKGKWTAGSIINPDNNSNNLFSEITLNYPTVRDINQTTAVLNNQVGLTSGQDYDKLERARMLESSEYRLNTQLGYISLNVPLASDQVLAVAFNYTMGGKPYQVGEFAKDRPSQVEGGSNTEALLVKLLKPVSMSPNAYTWHLMMKNIYKLGATQVQQDKFRLNITYQSDTVGTYLNYIRAGKIANELLLRVMKLDRLNQKNEQFKDGIFDYLEGLTINSEAGRIIFPVVEPFGSHLRKQIGNDAIADKYVYQELYDSTLTVAQQIADKNKFRMNGSYRASASSSVLNLNAMNVARGSVKVTANGSPLVENVDYTVDYTSGTVSIINQALIDAGTPISATLENQSMYNMKRKTLLGLNLNYEFSRDFNVGATIMHMYEKPLTMKTGIGEESLKNTLWGANMSYRTSSQWLTNLIDKLPFVNASAPSQITFNGEFAHLIAGHYENKYGGGYSHLDDFEAAKSKISVLHPYGWKLASTPSANFEEAKFTNDIRYGYNRAHLSWFTIDNLFTRNNSSQIPGNITKDSLSNHFVRPIFQQEIYPNRDIQNNQAATLSALNLSYYPEQRGAYNLDADGMGSDGKLQNPQTRWGGITRKLDNTNFESSNIEYIEFWLMDPFNKDATAGNNGGDLYFELGEISEDVLKDGRKFYENGLPTDDSTTDVEETAWGRVPKRQSTVYAFDNNLSLEKRKRQDAGLNGLVTSDELNFGVYKNYMDALRAKLSPTALSDMQNDLHSPLNDPGGDNYRYYRGADLDRDRLGILDRYKYYNGTEGNSTSSDSSDEGYASAANSLPDVEDLNQDYTMNESENFFQYRISLRPEDMQIGKITAGNKMSYISEIRPYAVTLADGNTDTIRWYQFKVPVRDGDRKGTMRDFKTIRFMRMFMTGFSKTTYLRFATLDLIRGEWRTYSQSLKGGSAQDLGTGVLNVSAVNLEENGSKEPVSYVVPPGVSRTMDPNQAQLTQDNEQALSMQVVNLEPEDARAIYKNTNYDLRRYKRLQMFTHAEALKDATEEIKQGEITVFLRLGSDYKNNYYEYEIPLTITPPGKYSTNNTTDRYTVWPANNMFDFPTELLTNLKLSRNKEKRKAGSEVTYTTRYSEYDPDKKSNKISIIGNPSLSEVSVMMVGIRNNSTKNKSAEVWVNDLRMTDYDEEGGWAAQGNLNIALSDIATVTLTGRKETAGFGSIDQSLMQRRNDDFSTYTVSTSVDVGRFLPEKAKISAPLYYSYSNQTTTPKYDPLDQDIKLKDALDVVETKTEKDSIKNLAQDKTITKNFSLTNIKLNIQSKNPMPYDPANFTFGYAFSKTETSNPTTAYDLTQNYKATLSYSYSPLIQTWEPFKDIKSKSPWAKYPQSLGINLLPSNISFNSYLTRYYTETLTRDLESFTIGGDNSNNQILSYSQDFYWDRDFSITWDFLKNLKLSIQTGTRAEIEEPYMQVNKKLNPDGYDLWKDEVMRSIRSLGDPLAYRQNAQVTYNLPFQTIPILDWISSSANYNSAYTWDRGAKLRENEEEENSAYIEIGNTVTNNMTLNLTNRFELTALYNKSPFLRKVNEKFESSRGRQSSQRPQRQKAELKKKPFQQDVRLNTDSGTVVIHNMNTKNILVTAKQNGKNIKLKYKRLDQNRIRINIKDSALIKLNIVDKGESGESMLYKVAQYTTRGLMSVRSIGINYSLRNETAISGFKPGIGDIFGQKNNDLGMAPGLGFAFGFEGGEDFFNKSLDNGWLVMSDQNISPAVYNSIRKFELEAQVEPIRGLKIRLNALHEQNERTSMQMSGDPNNILKTLGGSFAMTTVSLSSSFGGGNAGNGYKSKAFEKFRANRDILANRLESKYKSNNIKYPNTGFLEGTALSGAGFNPEHGGVNKNSADVLIPAFLAAYTGKDANKISFSPFPALTSLIPNWNLSYDGLTALPWFRDKFSRFSLMHSYSSQYRIGSYSSFLTWEEGLNGNGFGFTMGSETTDTKNPIALPTSQFDISSVSIVEQFNPLFGIEGTLKNNLTLNARYNYSRTLNLNITAYQLVENLQNDFVIGAAYKINEFNRLIGLPIKNNSGFNNDLNIRADLSNRTVRSLIRKIEDGYTEATSGNTILTVKVSAEYTLSRALLLKMYFDRIVNSPLISSSSYPTANTNFGFSLRFTLTQ